MTRPQGSIFQIRSKSDGRAYRPGRDWSNLFPAVTGQAVTNLARTVWDGTLKTFAEEHGVTDQSLMEAGSAMAVFITSVTRTGLSFPAAYENSGLARLPWPVQIMLFFSIGLTSTEAFFQAIREVTVQGGSPPDCDRVAQLADMASHARSSDSVRIQQRRAEAMSMSVTSEDLFRREE